MEQMPKVSVIIPVYNAEKYLRQCLDSVVNQTLREIEIICVDDGSTDGSAEILAEYRRKDPRIVIFTFPYSHSAFVARKKGVELSSGSYIWFVDSDDFLAENACEEIYNKISLEQVDILHFSAEIINCNNLPQARIELNERLLKPYQNLISGKNILFDCFEEKKYGFTLWNKAFSSALCKRAFAELPNDYLPKAQDMYSYFVLSYFASSYLGWESKPLYFYCFGRGVTGQVHMSLDTFERYCYQAEVVAALETFCEEHALSERHIAITAFFRTQWINECIGLWYDKLSGTDTQNGYQIMACHWDVKNLLPLLAKKKWCCRAEISKRIHAVDSKPLREKKVKRIGIYYYHLTIGGVQRVISLLIPLYQQLGYELVLITDSAPSNLDFALPDNVPRVQIFDHKKTDCNTLNLRLSDWEIIQKKYQLDLLIYHAWTSPLLLWDMLWLKQHGVSVVVQTHSVFSYSLININREFVTLPYVFSLCDGVVTLSAADQAFWSCFNDNVHLIPNPISDELRNKPEVSRRSNIENLVVWIGRFSNEKQPWDAINIMSKVIKTCPSAKLYMIGDADNSILEKCQKSIQRQSLENNIKLLGFQKDVSQFLLNAKVNLITSKYEGYSMVLLESIAHGIPSVIYDMPYLELAKPECGVISVEPNNCNEAATEIVKLLENPQKWEETSKMACDTFQRLASFDYRKKWQALISGKVEHAEISPAVQSMVNTILLHYSFALKSPSTSSVQKGNNDNGLSSLIIGFMLCLREHGLKYTLARVCVKIKELTKGSTL